MRIAYIAVMRMPTTWAHGVQIVNTCASLARNGSTVRLYHSCRYQATRELRGIDPYEFYGVERNFSIRRVPFLDIAPLDRWFRPVTLRLRPVANSLFAVTVPIWTRSWRPDLYYTRHWLTARVLTSLGLPVAFEMHQANTDRFSRRAIASMAKAANRSSFKFMATISEGLKQVLVDSGVPPEKIVVVPDAAGLVSDENEAAGAEVRKQLPVPADAPLAVYTGRIEISKGVDTVIKAASLAPEVSFLIVGGTQGEHAAVIKRTGAPQPVNLRFIERVTPEKARRYQAAADVLLLPQIDETAQSPLKLYEYISSGNPIVASDLAPIREVLEDQVSALLVPAGQPEALAACVQSLIANKQLGGRLSAAARNTVGDWDWDARAEAIVSAAKARL